MFRVRLPARTRLPPSGGGGSYIVFPFRFRKTPPHSEKKGPKDDYYDYKTQNKNIERKVKDKGSKCGAPPQNFGGGVGSLRSSLRVGGRTVLMTYGYLRQIARLHSVDEPPPPHQSELHREDITTSYEFQLPHVSPPPSLLKGAARIKHVAK